MTPIIGIMGAWLAVAGAQVPMLPPTAAGMTVWFVCQPGRPPADTAVLGSPVAMGIVHMPAFDDMAGVLVELTIGVPVFIMLFGLWLNWLLLKYINLLELVRK